MKRMLKEIVLEIISDKPASTREIAKAIATDYHGMHMGSSFVAAWRAC